MQALRCTLLVTLFAKTCKCSPTLACSFASTCHSSTALIQLFWALAMQRRHDREAVTNRETNVEYSRHRFDGMQESSSGCYLGAALPRICARTRLTSVKEGIQRLR